MESTCYQALESLGFRKKKYMFARISWHVTLSSFFSSKAVCQPNCSYCMNQRNSRLMFRDRMHLEGFQYDSQSVWIKNDRQNKNISAVMKAMKSTTKYNEDTNLLQNIFFFLQNCLLHWETGYWQERYVIYLKNNLLAGMCACCSQKSSLCWFL